MKAEVVIRNAQVVTPQGTILGGIAVRDGIIQQIGTDDSLPDAARVIDAAGAFVVPGLIEPHAHLGRSVHSNREPKELERWRSDFKTESDGAAHGGVTTILSHWTGLDNYVDALDTLIGWGEEQSLVDFNFHPVIGLPGHVDQLEALVSRGVASFKHYNYTYNDQRSIEKGLFPCDDTMLCRSFDKIAQIGAPAIGMVHAEDGAIIEYLTPLIRDSGRNDLEAWTLARPPLVENIKVRRVLDVAKFFGAPLYFAHVTTKEAVAMVAQARRDGQSVWGETQTCYLTHTADMEEQIGAWGKINPALKYEPDRKALWDGVRSGGLNCIGNDHLNYSLADKTATATSKFGSIWESNAGFPGGMQHMLPVMITAGVRAGHLNMEELVQICSTNTARAMGLYPRKGVLAPGSDADLVIVDPEHSKVVDEDFYRTNVRDWSLYWGWTFYGVPTLTMARGNILMEQGEIVGARGNGRFVPARRAGAK
jgi:dihydropyrimidinase